MNHELKREHGNWAGLRSKENLYLPHFVNSRRWTGTSRSRRKADGNVGARFQRVIGTRTFTVLARESTFRRAPTNSDLNVSGGEGVGEPTHLFSQRLVVMLNFLKAPT